MKLSLSAPVANHRLLRLPEVQRLTGLGRSQIYALASKGCFPKPLKLSERCSAWIEQEVQTWIGERVASANRAKV